VLKKLTPLIVVLLLIFGFTAVSAQDVELPNVGDVWAYTGSQNLMVRSSTVVENGNIIGRLTTGTNVTVAEVKVVNDNVWIRHNSAGSDGWSAWRYDGAYMFDLVTAAQPGSGNNNGDSNGSVYYYDATARVENIVTLNEANTGMTQFMTAAGFEFESAQSAARQPEEETLVVEDESQVLIVGWQADVTAMTVSWPACFTTDRTVTGVSVNYQPDRNNPSKLYTNNTTPFTGPVTVYWDCSNWGQLGQAILDLSAPAVEPTRTPGAVSTPVPGAQGCLTITQLDELGTIINVLEHPVGTPAGAQITLSVAYTAPTGWVMQKNGQEVTNAAVGETVSLWSPDNCRPLGQ